MTTEEKELLLKDLSARLPYGIKCQLGLEPSPNNCGKLIEIFTYEGDILCRFEVNGDIWDGDSQQYRFGILSIKPYLFPLSSMTEEQKKEFDNLGDLIADVFESNSGRKICIICSKPTIGPEGETEFVEITHEDIIPAIDWLNENHFDYRGLIGMGLAIDATNLNIY